ncbi:sulfotransferase [Catellatospora sp. KI3]|uniref:sulfotransferase family protein n=1 Tax=Catellatospora sp. KI3 TaxID=3041620 RepID=UPI002482BC72|nr:sulfotransferase [Catellatospora sp. KI3]MDI1463336.1 sulfotransferase [Catellatospora sp. KI3]
MDTEQAIDPDSLLADAASTLDLADFGPPGFRTGLRELARSLDHDRTLTRAGREQAREFVRAPLRNRLLLARQAARHPEIAAIPVADPVFVLGGPRSGTTLLHRLLAGHPGLHAPRFWELTRPVTPDGMTAEDLLRATEQGLADLYRKAPRFRAIHATAAQDPEECTWLLATEMASMVFSVNFDIPEYTTWLLAQELTEAYRGHRRQLQHLLWRRPATGTLLLKDPYHGLWLSAIDRVYPQARYLFLRRDPTTVTTSLANLVRTLREVTHDRVDPDAIEAECARLVKTLTLRQDPARRAPAVAGRSLEIEYDDLVAAPGQVVADVLGFLGLDVDEPREPRRASIAGQLGEFGRSAV